MLMPPDWIGAHRQAWPDRRSERRGRGGRDRVVGGLSDALRLLHSLVVLLCICLNACARPEAARDEQVVVFAAASLRDAFGALARDFERVRPGTKVTFNFGGTQQLRTQIEHGAAADVFASADTRHMDELVRASRASAPVVFAKNEPVLVVAKESAATIRGLSDLPHAKRIVIGATEVPIGRYTLQILDSASARFGADFRARVEARIVSRELNVRQVLAKVSLGEAQAGIVYRTDAMSAVDSLSIVTIPADLNVVAEYPIAVTTQAKSPVAARAFVDFVLSPDGQRALRRAGFVAP